MKTEYVTYGGNDATICINWKDGYPYATSLKADPIDLSKEFAMELMEKKIVALQDCFEALHAYRKAYDVAWNALSADGQTKVALAVLKAGVSLHDDHAAAAIAKATGKSNVHS